jgi:hypothetical protein
MTFRTAAASRLGQLTVVLSLYVASFALPVVRGGGSGSSGAAAFAYCLQDNEYPVFLALLPNVYLWAAIPLFALELRWGARLLGSAATAGAALVPLLGAEPWALGAGYYAWIGSMALLTAATWLPRGAGHRRTSRCT